MKQTLSAWVLSTSLIFAASPLLAQDAADASQTKSIQLVGARAELSKGIDAKKAKQGDPVAAKLQDPVQIPGSNELPKNTILVGHIDQVQPSQNKGDSTVQVTFDKAQTKDGQQLPIKATIIQIAPPANAMMNQPSAGGGGSAMPSSPSPSGGGASSGGSSGSSGGGGMQSSPAPSMASSMPSSDSSQPQQPQQGVPGVDLKSDVHDQNSGTFTSKGKNVHLMDGTQMQIALAVVPPNTQIK